MDKFIKLAHSSYKPRFEKVKIYTYKFSDDKIYIGYTSSNCLDIRHYQHKTREISPIYNYLKTEEIFPHYEETVTVNMNTDELYQIQRSILDKYTTDVKMILNPNLERLGY